MTDLWLILAMMVVTFGPRYLPFALADRLQLSPLLAKALGYVPIAILTAIIVLNTVVQEQQVQLDLHNHHLLAAVVAAVVAGLSKRLGLTVAVGLLAFVALRWFAAP